MKFLKSDKCIVNTRPRSGDILGARVVCGTPHEHCSRCGKVLRGNCPKDKKKFSFDKDCFLYE